MGRRGSSVCNREGSDAGMMAKGKALRLWRVSYKLPDNRLLPDCMPNMREGRERM
jgi:hypothetical protein